MIQEHLYFAYGMNLDPGCMRWGSAIKVGPGVLQDWHLEVRAHPFADVQPARGEQALGGLWRIDDACLRMLDGREGYRPGGGGMYDRSEVTVETIEGPVKALVYHMTERTQATCLGAPDKGYINTVRRGREYFGLPTDDLPTEAWLDEAFEADMARRRIEWAAIEDPSYG